MSGIAVLADIHGNLPALQAVLADMGRRAIGAVVNLGDHASGPLWPRETLALLMQQPWAQIAGNHDRQLVQQPPEQHGASDGYAFSQLGAAQLDWLRGLPAQARLPQGLLLCHGTPSSDSHYLLESVAGGRARLATPGEIAGRLAGAPEPVVLCGHSHTPRLVRQGETLIINPGSVGLPAYADDQPEPHVVEAGAPHARYALLEQHEGGWRVELVALGYDWQRAAAQAERNGRPDWAVALRTGFMSS